MKRIAALSQNPLLHLADARNFLHDATLFQLPHACARALADDVRKLRVFHIEAARFHDDIRNVARGERLRRDAQASHDMAHHFASKGHGARRILAGLNGRYVRSRIEKPDGRVYRIQGGDELPQLMLRMLDLAGYLRALAR